MRFEGFLLIVLLMFCSGCTGVDNNKQESSFSLSDDGILSLQVLPVEPVSKFQGTYGDVTVEEITFMTDSGNVSSVLIAPPHPIAGIVWAPGAGVPASGHIEHLKAYGEDGYAALVVDIRGNGGKTPGHPQDYQADYRVLTSGGWPQVYQITADLVTAERYLHDRFGSIPVWAVGESNGGRYAAQAVAADSGFTGFVGISTSGFDRQGDQYEGKARSFLLSVDPEALAWQIRPRPSLIFHAPQDTVIPVESGKKLATSLGNSSQFILFNGTHGINDEVDQMLLLKMNEWCR